MERELLLIRGPVLATTPIVQAVNRFPDTLLDSAATGIDSEIA
jgi:hypothetical protein